jgi:Protein of unknown function (DUF3307)
MPQLLLHLFGDYLLQSDWMAMNKSKRTMPCLVHVTLYTLSFLLLTRSLPALLVIGGTHFLIDRFGLIRYFNWIKNHAGPFWRSHRCVFGGESGSEWSITTRLARPYPPWLLCSRTGYFDERSETDFTSKVEVKLGEQVALETAPGFNEDLARKEKLAKAYTEACREFAPRPLFVTVWLSIIADNTLHLTCNYFALLIFGP